MNARMLDSWVLFDRNHSTPLHMTGTIHPLYKWEQSIRLFSPHITRSELSGCAKSTKLQRQQYLLFLYLLTHKGELSALSLWNWASLNISYMINYQKHGFYLGITIFICMYTSENLDFFLYTIPFFYPKWRKIT